MIPHTSTLMPNNNSSTRNDVSSVVPLNRTRKVLRQNGKRNLRQSNANREKQLENEAEAANAANAAIYTENYRKIDDKFTTNNSDKLFQEEQNKLTNNISNTKKSWRSFFTNLFTRKNINSITAPTSMNNRLKEIGVPNNNDNNNNNTVKSLSGAPSRRPGAPNRQLHVQKPKNTRHRKY